MTCFPALIAAGLLLAPAVGGAAEPSAAVVTLHGKDVGRSIVVRPGQEVRILLSVGGAGWNWVARPDPAYRLLAPIAVEADPEHRSRQATVVRIAFHTPGKTTVELAVVPNGGGGGGAANTLKYRFDVIG